MTKSEKEMLLKVHTIMKGALADLGISTAPTSISAREKLVIGMQLAMSLVKGDGELEEVSANDLTRLQLAKEFVIAMLGNGTLERELQYHSNRSNGITMSINNVVFYARRLADELLKPETVNAEKPA